MVETHFYAAGPSKTNQKKQWTIGTNEEKDLINQKINKVIDWQTKNKIFCWIGAWMPGDYANENSFTLDEQKSFAKYMTCELTKNKIPFAINADHHFYDAKNNEWNANRKSTLETILQTKCN
jgi:endoglucanase